jgi:uncharacterized protein (DUF488 family)
MSVVFTIGHSNHSLERFLALLAGAGVEMVADVRSQPASRHFPHFGKAALAKALQDAGISYLFLGRELGGRPTDASLFTDGIADFERMAETQRFREGLKRVMADAIWVRLALMCSEKEPLDCHRCLLVGRALAAGGIEVRHILADGGIVTQKDIEAELLGAQGSLGLAEDALAEAYRERANKIAFKRRAS